MRVHAFVSLLIAGAQVASAVDTIWARRFSFSDPSGQWNAMRAAAINADANALVYRLDERRAVPKNAPPRQELVYFDLSTGQEKAVQRLQ
jgi:hypothetical protein